MASEPTRTARFLGRAPRRLWAIGVALIVAGCGAGTASPSPSPSPSPMSSPSPSPMSSPSPSPMAATLTAAPSASETLATTATPTPTAPILIAITPSPLTVAPLRRLCTGPEQVGAITIWHVATTGTEIDFFTGTRTSTSGGTLCYLRGTSEAQVVAGGPVVADSGAASARIAASDPFVPVTPGDKVYSSVIWSNWCSKAPGAPITLAFVLPDGLGRVVLNTGPGMPAPPCTSSGSPSTVTPTSAWTH